MQSKNQKIRMRKEQVDRLFPKSFTKMRREDLMDIISYNAANLNERELNAVKSLISKDKGCNEFYVKKIRNGIELIPFDED